MELDELLKAPRFIVGKHGKATDVILSIEDWNALIAWLEDLQDSYVVKAGLERLKAVEGDRQKAGLMSWSEVEKGLDEIDDR